METNYFVELTKDELISIEGGKPILYYLGYAVGYVAGTTTAFVAGFLNGFFGDEKK